MNTVTTSQPLSKPLREDVWVISLIGVTHGMSHFSQLLLAPLFPWLKESFQVRYAELGALLTAFFVVSCVAQAVSGFVVDRRGPVPVLLAGLALIGAAVLGMAGSQHYWQLMLCAALAGAGNGVFHLVDFTLMNRLVSAPRLGHAYSAHGITGTLGWAVAPALLVPLALQASWRVALACAAAIVWAVWLLVWLNRRRLHAAPRHKPPAPQMPALASPQPNKAQAWTQAWHWRHCSTAA